MNESLVVVVRAVIGFGTILIYARMLGKQQMSQLTFFDYVMGITIGSTASSLTTDLNSSAYRHWVGLTAWVLIGLLIQWVTMKWRYAAKYLEGEPVIVIMNGEIMDNALKKMRYRFSDLLEQLREKDVFDLSQVQYAILEPDGQLSVLKKPQYQPLTPNDLSIPTGKAGISVELIYDGKVVEQNLLQINHDRAWLDAQLKGHGIKDPSEVALATISPTGILYVDRYEDKLEKKIDVGDYKGPY